jgi:hypothetical protein
LTRLPKVHYQVLRRSGEGIQKTKLKAQEKLQHPNSKNRPVACPHCGFALGIWSFF